MHAFTKHIALASFASAIAFGSLQAHAAAAPIPSAEEQPAPALISNDQDGFYVGGFGGLGYTPNYDFNAFGNSFSIEYKKPSYQAGGHVGYKKDAFRVELEGLYLRAKADQISVNKIASKGFGPSFVAALGFGNAYFDVDQFSTAGFTPYVGAGIGYGKVGVDYNNNGKVIAKQKEFAYQGIAGVKYDLTDKVGLFTDYRYVGTTSHNIPERFQSHTVNFGINYRI